MNLTFQTSVKVIVYNKTLYLQLLCHLTSLYLKDYIRAYKVFCSSLKFHPTTTLPVPIHICHFYYINTDNKRETRKTVVNRFKKLFSFIANYNFRYCIIFCTEQVMSKAMFKNYNYNSTPFLKLTPVFLCMCCLIL